MTLDDFANIATALGVIVSGFSLGVGFLLYRVTQLDNHALNTKRLLIKSRTTCSQVNILVTYDMAHEVSEALIFSGSFSYHLKKLWKKFFEVESQEDIEEYMKTEFPPITNPINSNLINEVNSLINDTRSDLAYIQNDHPGLFRVINPVLSVFSVVVRNQKRKVRDDDIWELLIPKLLKERSRYESFEEFQHSLMRIFTGLCQKQVLEHDQDDIDDLLSVLDMSVNAYLNLTNKELAKLSHKERSINFKPLNETKRINEDLREAEKALKDVLSAEDLLEYRELIVKVEQRNSERDN